MTMKTTININDENKEKIFIHVRVNGYLISTYRCTKYAFDGNDCFIYQDKSCVGVINDCMPEEL